MIVVGPISSVFDITTFFLLWYVFGANSAAHQSLFQSGWFIEGLLSQTLIVHMIRTQASLFSEQSSCTGVVADMRYDGYRPGDSLYSVWCKYRSATASQCLLSVAGRDSADLLSRHSIRKALVYPEV